MTSIAQPPARPLSVRQQQILELLAGGASVRQVCEVGVYRKTWTEADVRGVVEQHFPGRGRYPVPAAARPPAPPPPPPAPPGWVPAGCTAWAPPVLDDEPRKVVLTPMPAAVLTGLCRGWSNRQIGDALGIAEDTVKSHVRRLFVKLAAGDRCHAVALIFSGTVRIAVRPRRGVS